MNCHDFQNEYELQSVLSPGAKLHLVSCTDCGEHTRLLELLAGLERVEAPTNFDFQLSARIARGKPHSNWTGLFPSLRFILPFAAVVFAISIVGLSGLYFVNNLTIESVTINDVIIPNESNQQENIDSGGDIQAGESEQLKTGISLGNSPQDVIKSPVIAKKENEINGKPKAAATNPNSEANMDGGSRDSAVSSSPPLIQPEFDPNRKVIGSANPGSTTVTKLSDVWSLIGITVDSLKVISVSKSSVAERSGVKIGDVIEAIDGEKITTDSISDDQINVKSITVLRNGAKKEIPLTNK